MAICKKIEVSIGMKKSKKVKGFSLIELMVVVAILGILSSIATTIFQDYIARGQVTEALTLMGGQKPTIQEIFNDQGSLDPADNGYLGIPNATSIQGKYVENVEIINGDMVATMRSSNISKDVQGKKIRLKAELDSSKYLSWKCETIDILQKHIPKACRS